MKSEIYDEYNFYCEAIKKEKEGTLTEAEQVHLYIIRNDVGSKYKLFRKVLASFNGMIPDLIDFVKTYNKLEDEEKNKEKMVDTSSSSPSQLIEEARRRGFEKTSENTESNNDSSNMNNEVSEVIEPSVKISGPKLVKSNPDIPKAPKAALNNMGYANIVLMSIIIIIIVAIICVFIFIK